MMMSLLEDVLVADFPDTSIYGGIHNLEMTDVEADVVAEAYIEALAAVEGELTIGLCQDLAETIAARFGISVPKTIEEWTIDDLEKIKYELKRYVAGDRDEETEDELAPCYSNLVSTTSQWIEENFTGMTPEREAIVNARIEKALAMTPEEIQAHMERQFQYTRKMMGLLKDCQGVEISEVRKIVDALGLEMYGQEEWNQYPAVSDSMLAGLVEMSLEPSFYTTLDVMESSLEEEGNEA